jgi:hypothetical protein
MQMEQTMIYPGTLVSAMRQGGQQMRMVVTPTGGFQEMPGKGSREIPASTREQIVRELQLDFLDIARHAPDPKYVFAGGEHAKVGDREAVALDIYFGNLHERWFIDPASGELLRASYESISEEGPEERVIDYANWKQVDGLTLPFATTSTRNEQDTEKEATESWTINPKIDPALLKRPATP